MATKKITLIDDVTVGNFVKYSDKDKRGKFNYVGEVIHVDEKEEYFEMMTFVGDMGFSLKEIEEDFKPSVGKPKPKTVINNQLLEIITTKPKGWAKFKKNPTKFTEEHAPPKTIEPIKTQKQKVFNLVKENPKKKLKELLTLAKKQIGGDEKQLTVQIQLALRRRK